VRAAAVVVLSCVVAACGAAGQARRSVRVSGTGLAMLRSQGPPATTQSQANNAVEVLKQRCMRVEGMIYYPIMETVAQDSQPAVLEFPPYGSLAQREAEGYGLYARAVRHTEAGPQSGSTDNNPSHATDPEDAYIRSLPAASQDRYHQALFGVADDQISVTLPTGAKLRSPGSGCTAQAEQAVFGSVVNYDLATTGMQMLSVGFMGLVQSSPKYRTVVHGWSACMAGRGFRYANPYGIWNYFAAQYAAHGPTQSLRRGEIAAAVADWKCAKKMSLVPVTMAAQQAETGRLGKNLERYLLRIIEIWRYAARQAAKLGSDA